MKFIFLFFFIFSFKSISQNIVMFAGTYTIKGSQGIYVYGYDTITGQLTFHSSTHGIINPSFLAISSDKKTLYAVEENNPGVVSSFSINPSNGSLSYKNSENAGGSGPCHISIDKTGKWCFIANYSSGSISVLPISNNGNIEKSIQTIQLESLPPTKSKDGKPHAHSVNIAPNNKDVFITDLGTDKIFSYIFDEKSGILSTAKIPFIKTGDGSGPRHFVFHPDGKFAYCILETKSAVIAFKYTNGTLEFIHNISTLPIDYLDTNYCADIHISPDGKFLYGSNRGHNSIAIFSIDQKNGKLKLIGHQSTLGDFPRNFAIDPNGNFLLVANQKSDNIQSFKRDKKTGKLTYTNNEVKISMPVCLKFL